MYPALLCPITTKVKGYPFEVALPENIEVTGVVLADQIKSLDWQLRSCEFACRAPSVVADEVIGKLKILLTLNS